MLIDAQTDCPSDTPTQGHSSNGSPNAHELQLAFVLVVERDAVVAAEELDGRLKLILHLRLVRDDVVIVVHRRTIG